jgi:hypothetical protein
VIQVAKLAAEPLATLPVFLIQEFFNFYGSKKARGALLVAQLHLLPYYTTTQNPTGLNRSTDKPYRAERITGKPYRPEARHRQTLQG